VDRHRFVSHVFPPRSLEDSASISCSTTSLFPVHAAKTICGHATTGARFGEHPILANPKPCKFLIRGCGHEQRNCQRLEGITLIVCHAGRGALSQRRTACPALQIAYNFIFY
jgi:hypothetical protein